MPPVQRKGIAMKRLVAQFLAGLWILLCVYLWCAVAANNMIQHYPFPHCMKAAFQATSDTVLPSLWRQSLYREKAAG
jgi:hypothetical protein